MVAEDDRRGTSPERLSKETLRGLQALQEWLAVLSQAGAGVGEEFALPTDRAAKARLERLGDRVGDSLEGVFPSDVLVTQAEEEEAKRKKQEAEKEAAKQRALEEQAPIIAKPIWEALLNLPKTPIREGLLRKPVEGLFAISLNLRTSDLTARLARLKVHRRPQDKNVYYALELDLTHQTGGENPPIASGPLANVAAVRLEMGNEGPWAEACFQASQASHDFTKLEEEIVRPQEGHRWNRRRLITVEQVQALLPLLEKES